MAKSNDFEKKKKKENKEMSTGKFPQYHLHASTKKSCTYQIVCHQYKKLLHINYLSSISKLQISLNGFRVKILDLNCSNLSTTEHCINEDS